MMVLRPSAAFFLRLPLLSLAALALPWLLAVAWLWPEAGPLLSWRQWPSGARVALAFADLGLLGGRGALAYGLAWASLAGLLACRFLPSGLRWLAIPWALAASPLASVGADALFWIPSVALDDVGWRGPLMALLPLLAFKGAVGPFVLAAAVAAAFAIGEIALGVALALWLWHGRLGLRLAVAIGWAGLLGDLLAVSAMLSPPSVAPVGILTAVKEMAVVAMAGVVLGRLAGMRYQSAGRAAVASLFVAIMSPGGASFGVFAVAWLCIPGSWAFVAFAPAVAGAATAVQVAVAGLLFLNAPSKEARLDEPIANGLFPGVPYVSLPLEAAGVRVLFPLGINVSLVEGADPLRPDLSNPVAFPYPPLPGRVVQDLDTLRRAAGVERLEAMRAAWPGWHTTELPLISGRVVFVDNPTPGVPLAVPACGPMLPVSMCGTDAVAVREDRLRSAGLSPAVSTVSFVLWRPQAEVP
jgi:hypothetical protein